MQDSTVVLALIGIFSTVVATVFGAMTWTQKTLVAVLKETITNERTEKMAVLKDNRDQASTISGMGVSIDRLTDAVQGSQRILEDLVYGRETGRPRS